MKWLITIMVSLLILISMSTVVFAQANTATATATGTDVSSGISMVSSQQLAAKLNRINDDAYKLAQAVAPKACIVIIGILILLSAIIRRAWMAILSVLAGLVFLLWGVQIIGWILHFKNI